MLKSSNFVQDRRNSVIMARFKNIKIISTILFLVIAVAIILRLAFVVYYNNSISMIDDGYYSTAEERLRKLGDYRECYLYLDLLSGIDLYVNGQYEEAIKAFSSLQGFEPSENWFYKSKYEYAKTLFEKQEYETALYIFIDLDMEKKIDGIENIDEWIKKSKYNYALQLFDEEKYIEAISLFTELENFESAQEWLNKTKYVYGQQLFDSCEYIKAIDLFSDLDGFEDSQAWLKRTKYAYACQCFDDNNYIEAIRYFLELDDYEMSSQFVERILKLSNDIPSELLYLAAIRHYEQGLYRNSLLEFKNLKDYEDSEEYVVRAEQMLRRSLATTMSVGLKGSVAINSNYKVVRTPFSGANLNRVDKWENIVSISYFGEIAVGLRENGSVITNKDSINSSIENDWIENSGIIAVSAGQAYIICLKSDGTLISAGHDQGDNQRDVDDWTDIVAIATGWGHTVGLDVDGNVLITGYGSSKQLNQININKDKWIDIIAIAAGGGGNSAPGEGHTVGLRKDGKVVAVGDNSYNQCEVSEWENIIAIAAGDWFTVGLCKDGKVVITQPDQDKAENLYLDACNATEWSEIVAIAAGGGSVLGLHEDGSVEAAGYSAYSQRDTADSWENILYYGVKE